jgi:PAS domain S-box-containing protein
LLSDLSTTFINLPETQVYPNIEKSLGRIGDFLEMERITLFEFSHDGSHLIATSAWGKEKVSSLLPMSETKQWPWWTPRALRGEEVLCSNPNLLPDEASNERKYLLDSGIRSVASVPLQMGGGSIGCLSFVSKNRQVEWTRDLVRQLTVFAEIFSNALKRKRTEAILRESEERFRLVANTAPVLIWMSTPDKKCSYFNKPWLDFTGRSLESELGSGWAQGVHVEDLQKCLATYDRAFDSRHPFKMEYRLRRHDGEYRWVLDIGVPRFNADDSFAGYIGSCLDVTERKIAAEALAGVSRKLIDAQEKERARIARELHDDINQRLALLAIELQQLAQSPPPTVGEIGAYIHRLSTQVFEIGNDVQSISHSLHSSKLEYLGIVAAAKSLCKEFSEQQGVVVDFRHEGIPRTVSSDISLCLFRVLQEALHNAVKHSGVEHFEVEMHGESNGITLTVSDSGVGFDSETSGHSPGLGLISMRERVGLMDGAISITSKPSRGTVISVRIPLRGDGASTLVGEFGISADLAS